MGTEMSSAGAGAAGAVAHAVSPTGTCGHVKVDDNDAWV